MTTIITRRRVLGITAAAAGLALLPFTSRSRAGQAGRTVNLQEWRGTALGAEAQIQLHHPDPSEAERLIAAAVAEIARLEMVFSLYRPDSALSQLNQAGKLVGPPHDLVRLLSEGAAISELTGGAFDITVQPLWKLYAEHFGTASPDPAGPDLDLVQTTLTRVGWRDLNIGAGRIAFTKAGMAATLNGIAQGYITDRVVERLRQGGVERVLANLGETRCLGRHPDGSPWRIGLEDPFRRGRFSRVLELENLAVATSGGYGTVFEPSGRFNHLFDPASGRCGGLWPSVSVVAKTATMADALATAFCFMPIEPMRAVLAQTGGTAHVTGADAQRIIVNG
ncbi:MAG: FAD:protein FMN transferase [Rhodospirillaceae bacterium]